MTKQEIITTLKALSNSQGFYSSLYAHITEKTKEAEEYLQMLEDKQFKDAVDLIMYFEQ